MLSLVMVHSLCTRVPFERERPNGNSVTKQSVNYHLSDWEKSVEWSNGNLVTVLSLNCHSVI